MEKKWKKKLKFLPGLTVRSSGLCENSKALEHRKMPKFFVLLFFGDRRVFDGSMTRNVSFVFSPQDQVKPPSMSKLVADCKPSLLLSCPFVCASFSPGGKEINPRPGNASPFYFCVALSRVAKFMPVFFPFFFGGGGRKRARYSWA